jgi:hypothetical protein
LQTPRSNGAFRWLRQLVPTWAADPKTTIPQIQSALDEVLKAEAGPDADSPVADSDGSAHAAGLIPSAVWGRSAHLVLLATELSAGETRAPRATRD